MVGKRKRTGRKTGGVFRSISGARSENGGVRQRGRQRKTVVSERRERAFRQTKGHPTKGAMSEKSGVIERRMSAFRLTNGLSSLRLITGAFPSSGRIFGGVTPNLFSFFVFPLEFIRYDAIVFDTLFVVDVAQLVERLTVAQNVAGSNPVIHPIFELKSPFFIRCETW